MITKKSLTLGTAALALVPCLLLSCGEQKPKTSSGGVDAKPVAASGKNAVADKAQSAHFAAVNGHLDLGGTLYGYMDIDGDVERLAGMVQGFLDTAKEQAGAEMPPHLKNLDIAKVLDELGLAGVEALGGSSYKEGAIYHNKAYVHIPAGRKGLLKILGGGAAPFASKSLAPADTDLVWEMTLNVKAGYEVVSTMVSRVGGPEADQQFQQAVGEMIPQLGLSMNDILTKLNTRITVIGRIHPDKPLAIPDAPVPIPSFDLLIALDDAGWLFDKIVGSMKKEVPADQQAQMFGGGEGFEKVMLPQVPSPDMVIAQPVVYHDKASKRVLIGSTQAFVDECLAVTSGLLDSDAYKKAADGLPTEGNALSYVSARFSNEVRKLVAEAMKSAPQGGGAGPNMSMMMGPMMTLLDAAMPGLDQGQAGVIVNLPEGILGVSNAATSFKESVLASGVGFVAAAGLGYTRTASQTFPTPPETIEAVPFEAPAQLQPVEPFVDPPAAPPGFEAPEESEAPDPQAGAPAEAESLEGVRFGAAAAAAALGGALFSDGVETGQNP